MNYYNLKSTETFLVSQKAFILKRGKILLLHLPQTKRKVWGNKWGLPGGLLEMNENMETGLLREIKEETGLEVNVEKLFAVSDCIYNGFVFKDGRKLKARMIEICYVCKFVSGKLVISDEHDSYKWASRSELAKLEFSPDTEKLVQKYYEK